MKINREVTLKRLGDFKQFEIEKGDTDTLGENLSLLDDLIDSVENDFFSDEDIIRDFKRFGYYSADVPVME